MGKQDKRVISHHSSLQLTDVLLTVLFTIVLHIVVRVAERALASQSLPQYKSRHLKGIYIKGKY